MKKLVTTDSLKISKYIDSVSIDNLSIDTIKDLANSGKNKYDETDLINYFIKLINSKLKNKLVLSDNKLEKYLLTIKDFLNKLNKDKQSLLFDVDINLFDIYDIYIDSCKKQDKEQNELIIDLIKQIKRLIDMNQCIDYSKMKEYDAERIDKLTKMVSELSSKIGEYERLLKIAGNQARSDERTLNNRSKKVNEQKRTIAEMGKDIKSEKKRNEVLENDILKYKRENEKLRIAIVEANQNVEEKEVLNNKLNQELDAFSNNYLQALQEKEEALKVVKEIDDKKLLDEYILNLLFDNKYSLNALFDEVVKVHPNLSIEELKESLKRISTKVSINPVGTVELKKEYQVCPPYYKKYQKLLLNTDKKYKDVLFISDLHISETPSSCDYDINRHNNYFTRTLNDVYDYCAKNNIDIICNLGDLLDIRDFSLYSSKENYDRCLKVIEEANKFLPYDVNISHAIMGGNHDADLFAYGIDPISMLANSREDIIDLGYDDAFLKFKNSDFIGLHHKGIPKEEKMGNAIEFGKIVANNLNFKYSQTTFNRDNSYLDLFGHFHKSRLDVKNKYGVVPSLTTDRNLDGAWHLRFFFDDNGLIDYVIIYQLNFNQGLKVSMEIPYQRIRKQTTN